ncbi:STAS domain-containing protein [Thalassoglobus sp. JC818]|uniref:STAS domain-containing protein n=1 Tax=Thalassoglobus sp. JC818 TaxID=3232136 RepID=UPI00345A9508
MNNPLDGSKFFHVYKTGRLTIIGFDGRHLQQFGSSQEICGELLHLVEHHDCEVLVVDMMEVPIVSSWVLGILAAVQRNGIDIELYHPSDELREVLRVTNLAQCLHVREGFGPA